MKKIVPWLIFPLVTVGRLLEKAVNCRVSSECSLLSSNTEMNRVLRDCRTSSWGFPKGFLGWMTKRLGSLQRRCSRNFPKAERESLDSNTTESQSPSGSAPSKPMVMESWIGPQPILTCLVFGLRTTVGNWFLVQTIGNESVPTTYSSCPAKRDFTVSLTVSS